MNITTETEACEPSQQMLTFNIIYIPGMTNYLQPFVQSLLSFSDCSYRLVDNGCFGDEKQALREICEANSRLEYFEISEQGILSHCQALTILQRMEEGPYFCFMDADIFATDRFLEPFLELLKVHQGVSSGYPVWCAEKHQTIAPDWPDIGGRHVYSDDGLCLGASFFAIYDNKALNQFIQSSGIDFSRYNWDTIPPEHQAKLTKLNLAKRTYDTAKVLNILCQTKGNSLVFRESENLFHLGAMTEILKDPTDRFLFEKLPTFVHPLKERISRWIKSAKLLIRRLLRMKNNRLSEQQAAALREMLQTRYDVTRYFHKVLIAKAAGRGWPQQIRLDDPKVSRRVAQAAEALRAMPMIALPASRTGGLR